MAAKILIELQGTDAAKNLAFEEQLFRESRDSFVLLWRNSPCVIVGCHQDIEAETSALCRKTVPVLRRITGGGAVYHDLDNINFSFIENHSTIPTLEETVRPMVRILESLGLPVTFSGRNDLLLQGRKISGCAMRHSDGRTLTHGTLLFRRDGEAMQAFLTPSAEKLASHGVRSVESRTGEIAPYLPDIPNAESFMHTLREAILHQNPDIILRQERT